MHMTHLTGNMYTRLFLLLLVGAFFDTKVARNKFRCNSVILQQMNVTGERKNAKGWREGRVIE